MTSSLAHIGFVFACGAWLLAVCALYGQSELRRDLDECNKAITDVADQVIDTNNEIVEWLNQ
jgi:hypothetical protein